ncbi:type II toxin-antitoxin system YhaV family toxin [Sulfitobacter sp. M22298]|uniref:type II toxin-antitoxin system YhaV family toxin n=1 Tax=Sulfitobacter sp. M22298 TaxID=3368575 RepID=UPI003746E8DE
MRDEKTLRAYGRKTDPYATFRGMLDGGNPPKTFDALMNEAMVLRKPLMGCLILSVSRAVVRERSVRDF